MVSAVSKSTHHYDQAISSVISPIVLLKMNRMYDSNQPLGCRNVLLEDASGAFIQGGRPFAEARGVREMRKEALTRDSGTTLRHQVVDGCGTMAGIAVDELFEDAWFHGKNQICQIVEETDHVIVILDSECPDNVKHEGGEKRDSVITGLCRQGIVLYYYHSIHEKHHHVCLALKKLFAQAPVAVG